MRTGKISRKTSETDISVEINLDGTGRYDNATGVGFFDHMLDQLARSGIAMIAISSELPEVLAISDRIVTMQEGRISGDPACVYAAAVAIEHFITILAPDGLDATIREGGH